MNDPQARREEKKAAEALSASVQVLPLPVGLYLFSVRAAAPSVVAGAGNLALPAIHVGLGPGVFAEQVEFVAGPGINGTWLFAQGDMLVVKVTGTRASLVLTSIRAPGGETLSIKIERLESRVDSESVQAAVTKPGPTRPAEAPSEPATTAPAEANGPRLQISTHIRARGDRKFSDVPWAGRAGPGMWIESFSVQPLEALRSRDIEYKALTGNGFETPWVSDDLMCGTRGMAVPLIGFAVRLKASAETSAYECEYSGYFQSGTVSGPFRNGAPCRSSVANDPLEGLQVRIVKHPATAVTKPIVSEGGGMRPQGAMSQVIAERKSSKPVKRSASARPRAVPRPTGKVSRT